MSSNMTTDTDALQRAIQYLGAVEVAPGLYAHEALREGHKRYAVRLRADLEALGEHRIKIGRDGCDPGVGIHYAGTFVWLPAWWTPEQRVAWRNLAGQIFMSYSLALKAQGGLEDSGLTHPKARHGRIERITADLTTGEEVSA